MDKFEDFVYLGTVDVSDRKVFNNEWISYWENHILNCYEDIFSLLKGKIAPECPIKLSVNVSLLEETVVDAIIGMRKIVDSQYNSVEEPNVFKVISYLAYWWLRHKPANVHSSRDCLIEDVRLQGFENEDTKTREHERQKLAWQLKHINELVAVQMLCTAVFDFDNLLCDGQYCTYLKNTDPESFAFDDFDDMKDTLLKKLTYYLSYRAITPKVIEHILEGYTFHPAWGLTGEQWRIEKEAKI